jgi:hypothetical protein
MISKIDTGFLKYWNKQRAYGIIRTTPNDLGVWQDLFVHVTCIRSGDPIVGSLAKFVIGERIKDRNLLPAFWVTFSPKPEITDAVIATLTTPVVQS